jgi:hypothetical protein
MRRHPLPRRGPADPLASCLSTDLTSMSSRCTSELTSMSGWANAVGSSKNQSLSHALTAGELAELLAGLLLDCHFSCFIFRFTSNRPLPHLMFRKAASGWLRHLFDSVTWETGQLVSEATISTRTPENNHMLWDDILASVSSLPSGLLPETCCSRDSPFQWPLRPRTVGGMSFYVSTGRASWRATRQRDAWLVDLSHRSISSISSIFDQS